MAATEWEESLYLPISSNPHIFKSSYPHIFKSSYRPTDPHILLASNPHIFKSPYLQILLKILISSYPHISHFEGDFSVCLWFCYSTLMMLWMRTLIMMMMKKGASMWCDIESWSRNATFLAAAATCLSRVPPALHTTYSTGFRSLMILTSRGPHAFLEYHHQRLHTTQPTGFRSLMIASN